MYKDPNVSNKNVHLKISAVFHQLPDPANARAAVDEALARVEREDSRVDWHSTRLARRNAFVHASRVNRGARNVARTTRRHVSSAGSDSLA